MGKDSLGDRMKKYEESTDFRIISRVPIVIRLDGKAFSKLTKKLKLQKPFDESFSFVMSETARTVASGMQGCMIGYTQSDEMTFIIRSDQSLDTTPWFDNRIQKIVSVAASTAGAIFNRLLPIIGGNMIASFDCRAHPVPTIVEAFNNLVWRQNDYIKNSISSACYYELGHTTGKKTARKLMHKKNQNDQLRLLLDEVGINWHTAYLDKFKYGTVVFREKQEIVTPNGAAVRKRWVKTDAPTFLSNDGRLWLENILSYEADNEER